MSSTRYALRVGGRAEYLFEIRLESGWFSSWYTIHCLRHPPNPHRDGVGTSHLHPNGQVCVTSGREPDTLDKAKAIANVFAYGFSHYVRTGTFPNDGGRVNV